MGCFSFLCNECGKPINSDSATGENVRLSLLKNGKVIEEMQGPYDSYGRVFDPNDDSYHWKKNWDKVCDLMFDPDPSNGICAIHVNCITSNPVTVRSKDDPRQGWGRMNKKHLGKFTTTEKLSNTYQPPKRAATLAAFFMPCCCCRDQPDRSPDRSMTSQTVSIPYDMCEPGPGIKIIPRIFGNLIKRFYLYTHKPIKY